MNNNEELVNASNAALASGDSDPKGVRTGSMTLGTIVGTLGFIIMTTVGLGTLAHNLTTQAEAAKAHSVVLEAQAAENAKSVIKDSAVSDTVPVPQSKEYIPPAPPAPSDETSQTTDDSELVATGTDSTPLVFGLLGIGVTGVALIFTGAKLRSNLSRKEVEAEDDATAPVPSLSWESLLQHKDELILAWSRYETDVALMIDYPVMTDYSEPLVQKVIKAMRKMRRAEMNLTDKSGSPEGSALETAIDEFEVAFLAAERYAKRHGHDKLAAKDRSKLSAARQALNIILNEESPAHEIEAAYKSLRGSLKGIIDLPEKAVAALEARTHRALEALPA